MEQIYPLEADDTCPASQGISLLLWKLQVFITVFTLEPILR
jgi:hypothetical protein